MSISIDECIELSVEAQGAQFKVIVSKDVSYDQLHTGLFFLLQEVTRLCQDQEQGVTGLRKPGELSESEWDYYISTR